ncbi:MAG TPA: cell division protein ZapD [Thiotrichaceae bacterium]|jgi:cell division protein ZapD|nr:cell division protein ZapD [Thiotrichaceae bacterium]HIM07147.1 cell division protein ZapD [Gammaproteobacteria bacterium]
MQNIIVFEQPLNERMRNLLRLEHLFNLISHRSNNTNKWDYREILESLLEVSDLLSRSDFKVELIKELKRHSSILTALENNPAVDQNTLKKVNSEICELSLELSKNSYQPGNQLKNDELVTSFKQRISIPGGTCNFDLPRFHYWLNQTGTKQQQDLDNWSSDLSPIRKSVILVLDMIRNSANPSKEKAETGFYQKTIEPNLSCQLIRVLLPSTSRYYPEISGGKQRFSIRFMEDTATNSRAVQTSNEIDFKLHCCIL